MKLSRLSRECISWRRSIEADGYRPRGTERCPWARSYFYMHPNGNTIAVRLDLDAMRLRMFKNAHLVKELKGGE